MSGPRYNFKLDIEQDHIDDHFVFIEIMFDLDSPFHLHIYEEWKDQEEIKRSKPVNIMMDHSHMEWLIEMLQDALLKSIQAK